jgi:hypothetical protein
MIDHTELALVPIYRSILAKIILVQNRVANFKARAKEYYFEVILSQYQCPECKGDLTMVDSFSCRCLNGHTLDPTTAFQVSDCCGAALIRKTFHYTCSRCSKIVTSRFLFDERIFDKDYFREMMQESRSRYRRRREELRRLLAQSRSDTLRFLEEPVLDTLPGLTDDLDAFIGSRMASADVFSYKTAFSMAQYRGHILSVIGPGGRLFSSISPMSGDSRKDKAWRFITLLFMEQDREVTLTQYGQDLLVERFNHEAYA